MSASQDNTRTLQEKQSFYVCTQNFTKQVKREITALIMFGHELHSNLNLLLPDIDSKLDKELVKQQLLKPGSNKIVFKDDGNVWVLNKSGSGYKKENIVKVNELYSYLVNCDELRR